MEWRRLTRLLSIAGLTWILGVFLGLTVSPHPLIDHHSYSPPDMPTVWSIFSKNLQVLIGCFMGLFTFSLASLVTLIANGIYVGIQWQIFAGHTPGWNLPALLIPHGLLEIPGMLLAGAIGLMGRTILCSCYRSGVAGIRLYYRPLLYGVSISVILILLGAIMESWGISRL